MSKKTSTMDSDWSKPGAGDQLGPAPTQPAGSQIAIERFADGISISVPPAGLWRGSAGLFVFALLWNGIMLVIAAVLVVIALNAKPDKDAWIFPLALSFFGLAGIGLLLIAIHMGRRQAGLAVAGGTLMVLQTGLFGKKQREWPLEEVSSICTGSTGMEVNDVPVRELQIRDHDGTKFGLLAGRSDAELEWLAYELRQAAKMPNHDGHR
jgi:hypothetical protein